MFSIFFHWPVGFSSVQFSYSVVSDSLRLHGLKHTKLLCPALTPRVAQTHAHQVGDAIQTSHPLSSPSSPAFSLYKGLSKRPTDSCQKYGLFPVSQYFTSGGQSIGVSVSASVFFFFFFFKDTNIYVILAITTVVQKDLTCYMDVISLFSEYSGLISLQSKGLSRVFSNTTVQKHQFFDAQLSW